MPGSSYPRGSSSRFLYSNWETFLYSGVFFVCKFTPLVKHSEFSQFTGRRNQFCEFVCQVFDFFVKFLLRFVQHYLTLLFYGWRILQRFHLADQGNHPLHRKGRIQITLNRSCHDQFYSWESTKIKIKITVEMEWSTTTKWRISASGRWLDARNQQTGRSVVWSWSSDDRKLSIAPWKHQEVKKKILV